MSSWGSTTAPGRSAAWMLAAGILLLAVALVLGLVLMLGGGPGERPEAGVPASREVSAASHSPDPTAGTTAGSSTEPKSQTVAQAHRPAAPALVTWGGSGNQLAAVIRNDTDRQIRWARVEITTRDAAGNVLVATTGAAASTCCTVLGLPPGEDYGLFLNLDRPVSDVAEVQVRYAAVRTRPARASQRARIEVSDASFQRVPGRPGDAVVDATFTAHGEASRYVVGQAFLVGPGGALRAVLSGRYYCYRDGDQRRVRLERLQPVPPGTRLERVVAYPIPRGEARFVPMGC